MAATPALQRITAWPEPSREAACFVIEKHGEPDKATDAQLTWQHPGLWKRIVATKEYYQHNFPAPYIDT